MSKESLERFMEKVGNDDELRVSIESQLDSDGNISVDALIALGTENGCEFSAEDLTENAELSDEELDNVAGGVWEGGGGWLRKEIGQITISQQSAVARNQRGIKT